MTLMKANQLLLPSLLSLIILGAGCLRTQPTPSPTPQPAVKIEEIETTQPEVEKTEDGSEVLKVNIEDGNFFFSPSTITAAAGQTVEVTITGHEGFHTFVISDIDLKKTLQNGASFTFVAPSTPGEYEIFCDIGNHKAQGMVGTLIVI